MFATFRKNLSVFVVDLLTSPLKSVRAELLEHASGQVADIGIGGGNSLPMYTPDVEKVYGVEPDPAIGMLERRAKKYAGRFGFDVVAAPGELLPFEDQFLDTVTFQLVLCTIPDPVAAIKEARRVLKPSGKLLFLEHIRHSDPRVASFQDRLTPHWSKFTGGCRLNQDTPLLLETAGFEFIEQHSVIDKSRPRFLSHITWGSARPI